MSLKKLAEQLREAFVATLKSISELEVGMVVQVRIRGVVQKVGVVRFIDPEKKSATVEDWWMKGKMTAYDDRYAFYQIPPPQEVVFAGEQTEEFAEFSHTGLQVGIMVQVRSRTSGNIVVQNGRVERIDHDSGCIEVLERGDPRRGDMAQAYCKGGYRFYVWIEPAPTVTAIPYKAPSR